MKRASYTFLFLCIAAASLTVGCKKDAPDATEQAKKDQEIIEAYIADNSLNALSTGSGLHYIVDDPGTGKNPDINSTVRVNYRGFLTDGTQFDASGAGGTSFPLNSVIVGWQEGIPLYMEGGSGTLIIPSALGYGAEKVGDIPANSVLVFTIELLEVN